MSRRGFWGKWRGVGIATLILSALPGAVLAIPAADSLAHGNANGLGRDGLFSGFTPSGVDSRLAALAETFGTPERQAARTNPGFRFTPAGANGDGARALTIAVRSRNGANALAFKRALDPAKLGLGEASLPVTIRPSSYSLGAARGLQNFTLPQAQRDARAPVLTDISRASGFSLDQGGGDKPSRFASRVNVSRDAVKTAATAPLADDIRYDLGGSFSVTRSVAVTAGVRYERDMDSAQRLTDEATDQQAVYVGTLIRF